MTVTNRSGQHFKDLPALQEDRNLCKALIDLMSKPSGLGNCLSHTTDQQIKKAKKKNNEDVRRSNHPVAPPPDSRNLLASIGHQKEWAMNAAVVDKLSEIFPENWLLSVAA